MSKKVLILAETCQFLERKLSIFIHIIKDHNLDVSVSSNFADLEDLGDTYAVTLLSYKKIYLTESQIEGLEIFLEKGGKLLATSSYGGDIQNSSNLNNLTSKFGLSINNDSVVRAHLYEQNHPKEAVIEEFVSNSGFLEVLQSVNKEYYKKVDLSHQFYSGPFEPSLKLLYPLGCTLSIRKPSIMLFNSSKIAIPVQQAILGLYRNEASKSTLLVSGSSLLFFDSYIKRENNLEIVKVIVEYLLDLSANINLGDAQTVEASKQYHAPDLIYLTDKPTPSFPSTQKLPKNRANLIDNKLFEINNSLVPLVLEAYQDLNVTKEPLSLIKPVYESPDIEYEMCSYGPIYRDIQNLFFEELELD